ncbi:phosphodiester glycosidase family protein [Nocardioides sp. YIM 152315]|uniref:phosphodiester glycosidase family protein n=1 Tax=Nocardioides sp. YIM 152315 TaxID=3031760 RepID=UPI0023D9FD75|nr:phosphodiester glycosidase family protein [Nocardioides sp. YIM 152315]MDF1604045.1 phosphodiester glycosidase family protein [Nocardioides sp. YIM 152315]
MRTRLTLTAGLTACALVAASPALGDPGPDRPPTSGRHYAVQKDHSQGRSLNPRHTSGDEPGWIAPRLSPGQRRAPARKTEATSYAVVPGVTYSTWTQTDARGPIVAHLLTVDPKAPGVGVNYLAPKRVAETSPLGTMLEDESKAVAGVNGDFFDIGRTGAPLGLGLAKAKKLLHGRVEGWNSAFYFDKSGDPQIGELPMIARVRKHRRIDVTGLNQPFVARNGVGVYTKAWGKTDGYTMTQGQRKHIRVVWVRKHRVYKVRRVLKNNRKIPGTILVGRGDGARQLKKLKKGRKVVVKAWLKGHPKMAISGDRPLIDDGVIKVVDNRVMHPRTAVGVDRESGQILLLVIDGRSSASRGYTMVELANLMIDLGADEALNLDGGGSSTMIARDATGADQVLNRPSDGYQRWVANGIQVTYKP